MISFREYLIDNKLEQYLFDDIELLVSCLLSTTNSFLYESYKFPLIFESKNIFQNYEYIIDKITNEILKAASKGFNNEDEFNIPIKMVQDYPKNVNVSLMHSKSIRGSFNKIDGSESYITIELCDDLTFRHNEIKSIVLHELLHGYEEFLRKSNNMQSIFHDFGDEYHRAFNNLVYPKNVSLSERDAQRLFVLKYIAICKYFYNEHEIFAYCGMLEHVLKDILKQVKPNYKDLKYDDAIELLRKKYVWKNYFDFGKFVAYIDKIDDNILEDAYTYICKNKETIVKLNKERFELVKKYKDDFQHLPKKERYIEKSANEIRQECKNVWKKFKSQFDIDFAKVYTDVVIDSDKRIF